jgi:hypothetical protein
MRDAIESSTQAQLTAAMAKSSWVTPMAGVAGVAMLYAGYIYGA